MVLGVRRNGAGLRFSSTEAQGQKPVSPHVSSPNHSLQFVPAQQLNAILGSIGSLRLTAASQQIGFYKTFTRPIAKVLLMATFTYQLAYWGWQKLEKEEIKRNKTGQLYYFIESQIMING